MVLVGTGAKAWWSQAISLCWSCRLTARSSIHAVAHLAADRGGEAADLAADPYATASSGQTGVPGRALSAPNLLPQATAAEKDLVRVAVHKPREESERLLVLSDACCPSLAI